MHNENGSNHEDEVTKHTRQDEDVLTTKLLLVKKTERKQRSENYSKVLKQGIAVACLSSAPKSWTHTMIDSFRAQAGRLGASVFPR